MKLNLLHMLHLLSVARLPDPALLAALSLTPFLVK